MTDQLPFDSKTSREVEAIYLSPRVVARRRRVLTLLKLRPGENVLDIGAGPGFLADEIAEEVGASGRVVGVDLSPAMLGLARHRCARRSNVSFQEADVVDLPFLASTFDAAVASQVYEYVSDIPVALRELYRVLRPGGHTVIVDMDWASLVWEVEDRARAKRVLNAWDEHLADPHLPRRLLPYLKQSGFGVLEVEPFTMFTLSSEPYVAGLAKLVAAFVPGRRGVTADEASAWLADLAATDSRGEYFFSITAYLFFAKKSAAA